MRKLVLADKIKTCNSEFRMIYFEKLNIRYVVVSLIYYCVINCVWDVKLAIDLFNSGQEVQRRNAKANEKTKHISQNVKKKSPVFPPSLHCSVLVQFNNLIKKNKRKQKMCHFCLD